jgi:hypothetical protein
VFVILTSPQVAEESQIPRRFSRLRQDQHDKGGPGRSALVSENAPHTSFQLVVLDRLQKEALEGFFVFLTYKHDYCVSGQENGVSFGDYDLASPQGSDYYQVLG